MGFCSCIRFALTDPGPERVLLSEIARLIRVRAECGLFAPGSTSRIECVFGDRYDRDIDSIMELVAENPKLPTMLTGRWMPMDLDVRGVAESLADEYRADDRSVYRATVHLGRLSPELRKKFTVVDAGSLQYFRPESVSFHIDPWTGVSDAQNADVVLGYLSFQIYGDGLFYPRTAGHYIESMGSFPPIAAITEACAAIWPATPRPATDELIEIRRSMGTHWPHAVDVHTGWHWSGE